MAELRPAVERRARTVEEFRKIFGLGRCAAYSAIKNGDVHAIKLGKRILISQSEIDRLLATSGGGSEAA